MHSSMLFEHVSNAFAGKCLYVCVCECGLTFSSVFLIRICVICSCIFMVLIYIKLVIHKLFKFFHIFTVYHLYHFVTPNLIFVFTR